MNLSALVFTLLCCVNSIACSNITNITNRVDLDTRIVGGQEVDISVVPYQVALLRMFYMNGASYINLMCGGAIITSTYVLTAGDEL